MGNRPPEEAVRMTTPVAGLCQSYRCQAKQMTGAKKCAAQATSAGEAADARVGRMRQLHQLRTATCAQLCCILGVVSNQQVRNAACQTSWRPHCTLGVLGNHGLGSQRGALHGCAKVNIQGLLPLIIFEHITCRRSACLVSKRLNTSEALCFAGVYVPCKVVLEAVKPSCRGYPGTHLARRCQHSGRLGPDCRRP